MHEHALPKVALNRQLPLKNLVCYIMASTKLGVHFCENYLRIYHKCCADEKYIFQKPGQICECTNHQQKQPSKILMNFKGDVSVNCHNAPNYFYFSLSFFWWFFHLENWIEYDMFPNNTADFFYALCPSSHQFNFQNISRGALRKHENFDIIWMFMQCGLKMLKLYNEY